MSFEVRWEEFRRDENLSRQIVSSLNRFFSTVELPTYLHHIQIERCKFGKNGPSITLRDITLPLPDFYSDDNDGRERSIANAAGTQTENESQSLQDKDNDVQLLFDVKYNDNIYLELNTSLVLNYPDKRFMELPMNIKMSFLSVHVLCILSWLQKKRQAIFSILCDIDDDDNDDDDMDNNNNSNSNDEGHMISARMRQRDGRSRRSLSGALPLPVDEAIEEKVGSPLERLTIIKNLQIETEIGAGEIPSSSATPPTPSERQQGSLHHVDSFYDSFQGGLDSPPTTNGTLRNLDKLKLFLLEKLKDFLRREVGWPNWMVFDMNSDET